MDDFSSSLIKLKKEQEKERKRLLEKKNREKKSLERNRFEAQDYLSGIERAFIRQQKSILHESSTGEYSQGGLSLEEENGSYLWILKLNLSNENISKFPNNGETDLVILPEDLLKILSMNESLYPLHFNVKCLNHTLQRDGGSKSGHSRQGGNGDEERDGSDQSLDDGTHCGVLDYSERSGFISLPNKVLRCLNIDPESICKGKYGSTIWIQIAYKRLPKGSLASFEVLNNGDLFKMHDIESLLESYLRNHFLTLTVGDTLMVNQPSNYLDSNYCISLIKVRHLEPESSVSLINTDISLDIIYKENDQKDGNVESGYPKSGRDLNQGDGGAQTRLLSIGEPNILDGDDCLDTAHFKIDLPFGLKKAFLADTSLEGMAKLVISVTSNYYFDIFVSFPPIFEASSHLHIFRSFPEDHKRGDSSMKNSTNLVISSIDFINYLKTLETNTCSDSSPPSICSSLFPSIMFITIEKQKYVSSGNDADGDCRDPTRETPFTANDSSSTSIQVKLQYNKKEAEQETEITDLECSVCRNCNRRIPAGNFGLHSIQCERMYKICDICNLVLEKRDFEKHTHCNKCIRFGLSSDQVELHDRLYHQHTTCRLCGQDNIQPIQLRIHQTQECPKRIILCRFCNSFVQAGTDGHYVDYKDKYYYNLTSHESYCGSRTTNCHLCSKVVLIKELKSHIDLIHPK